MRSLMPKIFSRTKLGFTAKVYRGKSLNNFSNLIIGRYKGYLARVIFSAHEKPIFFLKMLIIYTFGENFMLDLCF